MLQTSAFLTGAPRKYAKSNAHDSAVDQIVLLRRRVRLETDPRLIMEPRLAERAEI